MSVRRNCMFNFCEDVDDYPQENVNNIIPDLEQYKIFFKPHIPDIGSRMDNHRKYACSTHEETKYPKTGIDTQNNKRLILNSDEHRQEIKVNPHLNSQLIH